MRAQRERRFRNSALQSALDTLAPKRSGALAFLTLAGVLPGVASAIALGSATVRSHIGEPVRIEIPLVEADRLPELRCISLTHPTAERSADLPWLAKGSFAFDSRGSTPVLVLRGARNDEPVLSLAVSIGCGHAFRREYTLLFDTPGLRSAEVALPEREAPTTGAVASPARIQSSPARGADAVVTGNADSARLIANRLYPGNPSAQRRMARAILAANASALADRPRGTLDRLPPGISLTIPPLPAALPPARTATGSDRPPARTPRETRQSAPRQEASQTTASRDRLIVSGGADSAGLQLSATLAPRAELDEAGRERLRTENQLIAALDEKIATQLELAERLRQLEALQNSLRADTDRLEARIRAGQSQIPATAQSVAAAAVAPVAAPAAAAVHGDGDFIDSLLAHWQWLLAALLACAGVAVFMLRRVHNAPAAEDASSISASTPTPFGPQLTEADIWPDRDGYAPLAKTPPPDTDTPLSMLPSASLGPSSVMQIVESDLEEHDSTVELADIMMSFGRVQGAAQTLSDFIRANPKQAVRPWIKLLEVYRSANMQMEYEALSGQLNKSFNVRPVPWDEFEHARDSGESLESMPHIMVHLIEQWGTRECQAYLHHLLRDNRQGTRQGFPLAMVDEIVLLLRVLEARLGPFRPDPPAPDEAPGAPVVAPPATPAPLDEPPIFIPPAQPRPQEVAPAHEKTRIVEQSGDMKSTALNLEYPPQDDTQPGLGLDFDIEKTDLSKTLYIDLDMLNDTSGDKDRKDP